MATVEQSGFLKYKDSAGNTYLVLPITTKDNVDGIDEIEAAIEALQTAIGTKAAASDLTSHTGNKSNPHGVTKTQVGLGNVENKSSATIRGELTKDNVTTALGYTPPTTNTTYSAATTSVAGLMSASDKSKLDSIAPGADAVSVTRSLTSGTKIGSITINSTSTDLYAPCIPTLGATDDGAGNVTLSFG